MGFVLPFAILSRCLVASNLEGCPNRILALTGIRDAAVLRAQGGLAPWVKNFRIVKERPDRLGDGGRFVALGDYDPSGTYPGKRSPELGHLDYSIFDETDLRIEAHVMPRYRGTGVYTSLLSQLLLERPKIQRYETALSSEAAATWLAHLTSEAEEEDELKKLTIGLLSSEESMGVATTTLEMEFFNTPTGPPLNELRERWLSAVVAHTPIARASREFGFGRLAEMTVEIGDPGVFVRVVFELDTAPESVRPRLVVRRNLTEGQVFNVTADGQLESSQSELDPFFWRE
jgi:hypothetical protein